MDAPLNYRVVKHVTRPLLKLEAGQEYFVTIESKIFDADPAVKGRERSNADGSKKETMAPPRLMDVLDLVHASRPSQIIVNTVLESELVKKYPSDSYVGKSFMLVKNQIQGRRYATFQIAEIALNDAEHAQQAAPQGKAKK